MASVKQVFFKLGLEWLRGAAELRLVPEHRGHSASIYRGEFPGPVRLFTEEDGKYYDIVMGGFAELNLVSPRFLEVVTKNGLTGIKPVDILIDEAPSEHKLISVQGKCGPILNILSTPRKVPYPNDPPKTYTQWFGLYFDENTWDGSDFFYPAGSFHTVISQRAAEILEEGKLKNLSICPMSEISNHKISLRY